MFQACMYCGKPAVYDTEARVYYMCKTMKEANNWACELNAGK